VSRIEAEPEPWQERAACRSADPEVFYDHGRRGLPEGWDVWFEARPYCARCPVTVPCLELALSSRDDHGFYAGTTPADRRSMRRNDEQAS
jgi:WhiB family redox-sensing transcriptional regulator